MKTTRVQVYAPRSIANFGTGFDALGGALNGLGDVVEAGLTTQYKGARLKETVGMGGMPAASNNVVVAVANELIRAVGYDDGLDLILHKNLEIGTGTGSSASSGAAAAEATRLVLGEPFPKDDRRMLDAVIYGEAVATNTTEGHADNAFPALLGGLVLVTDFKERKYQRLEGGHDLYFLLVKPQGVSVNTGDARRKLAEAPYYIPDLVALSIGFMTGKYQQHMANYMKLTDLVKEGGDQETVRRYLQGSMKLVKGIKTNNPQIFGEGTNMDDIVTPVRAQFIPGYGNIKKAALESGAYGFSIAGSGPTMFGVADPVNIKKVESAITEAAKHSGISVVTEMVKIGYTGAALVGKLPDS